MGKLTGASAAKKAAKAQEAALQEQTKQATNAANEAARQSAISAANAAARDAASQQVEAETAENTPGGVDVDVTPTQEAPARKRARFSAGQSTANSITI